MDDSTDVFSRRIGPKPSSRISLIRPVSRADGVSLKGNVFVCILKRGLCVHGTCPHGSDKRLGQALTGYDLHKFHGIVGLNPPRTYETLE